MKTENIPFEKIELEEGFNTRYDYGDLVELKNSIVERGIEIPLVVIHVYSTAEGKDKYILVGGHRRFNALKLAWVEREKNKFNFSEIPCDVRTNYSEQERTLDIIIHNQGKPLLPLEEAETYKRLIEVCKVDVNEISRLTGKRRPHINSYLSLAYAGEKIKQLVKEATISPSTAIQVISLHRDDEEAQLAEISGAMNTAINEGSRKVNASHIGKVREKKPLPKFNMLMEKIKIENVASKKKVIPEVNEAIQIVHELLFEWLPVNKAYERLNQIKTIKPKPNEKRRK